MPEIKFEWDSAKAQSNLAKHGIAFEEAAAIFQDEHAVSVVDPDSPAGEERWITTGWCTKLRLLIVVHTDRDISDDVRVIRIISARRASRSERRQYEQA